jgi:hypothetical protein
LQRTGEHIAYFGPVFRWLFFPSSAGGPSRQVFDQSFVEPPLAFVEYTGIPSLLGGSVVPVTSQVVFQGGQAKYITQPAAASVGKPLSLKNAFALEFVAGTLIMAGALTIIDPADHRTGGLAETTWYKNNIVGGPEMWNTESKFDIGI